MLASNVGSGLASVIGAELMKGGTGLNADLILRGTGIDGDQLLEAPVPEPSTIALWAVASAAGLCSPAAGRIVRAA